ncbi:GIY-YIG nuclease family protein [Novosphingobium malaysiense]|uniref:GIY-YIG domain-containing protein n=1 Tax=Novosphingobium malaysiense TaxID=1348853 RepID=A0A0B1ZMV6_9SPHN|nr:GIY-YIG nuclease family protein [Novosphingobium malaysiense]KHK92485.1 hypothetical protein LK12_06730 [Novosphingobium malaysiense]
MTDKQKRKAALADYRERKVEQGIFALRCRTDDGVWVGRAQDLSKVSNRLFFTLRQDAHPHPRLQAAWNTHGAGSITFEVLEVLDPEELGLGLEREMKGRHADWVERLGAIRI